MALCMHFLGIHPQNHGLSAPSPHLHGSGQVPAQVDMMAGHFQEAILLDQWEELFNRTMEKNHRRQNRLQTEVNLR